MFLKNTFKKTIMKTIIAKIISINLIMIFFVIIFLLYNNYYIQNNLNSKWELGVDAQLKSVRNSIYSELKRIQNVSLSLSSSNSIYNLSNSIYYSNEYFSNVEKIKSDTSLVGLTMPYNTTYYLKIKNHNTMITSDGSLSIDTLPLLLKRKYPQEQLDAFQFQNLTDGMNFFNSFAIYANNFKENISVLTEIQTASFQSYIFPKTDDVSAAFFVFYKDKLFISTNNTPVTIEQVYNSYTNKINSLKMDNIKYKIIALDNSFEEPNLTFICLFDTALISKDMQPITNYTILVLLIFILINLIVMSFQYKIYNPIKQLVAKINNRNNLDFGDDINTLNTAFDHLKEDNQNMKTILSQTTDIYKIRALSSLILGEDKEIEDEIIIGLNNDFEQYVTIKVIFESENQNINEIERMLKKDFYFVKAINEFQNCVLIVECYDTEKLKKYLINLLYNELIEDSIYMGISKTFCGIQNLCTAHVQSIHALIDNSISTLLKHSVGVYSEQIFPVNFTLTNEQEKELINLVINADAIGIESFFEDFILSSAQDVSYKNYKRFYSHLISILENIMYIKNIKNNETTEISLNIESIIGIYKIHSFVKLKFVSLAMLFNKDGINLYNKIIKYIDDNIQKELSVNAIAYTFGITTEYLSSYFKKKSGQNLSVYINNLKMDIAVMILNKNKNIKISDLGIRVGIEHANTFTRQFKTYTGMTPTQYKETL